MNINIKCLSYALLVNEIDGIISRKDNKDTFTSLDGSIEVPLNFMANKEDIGQEITAYIRAYDKELLLELGSDDKLHDDINEDNFVIEAPTDILLLIRASEEKKTNSLIRMMILFVFIISCYLGAFLLYKLYDFDLIRNILLAVSIAASLFLLGNFISLNNKKIKDRNGNWVNLDDGTTSLNGGEFHWCYIEEGD